MKTRITGNNNMLMDKIYKSKVFSSFWISFVAIFISSLVIENVLVMTPNWPVLIITQAVIFAINIARAKNEK